MFILVAKCWIKVPCPQCCNKCLAKVPSPALSAALPRSGCQRCHRLSTSPWSAWRWHLALSPLEAAAAARRRSARAQHQRVKVLRKGGEKQQLRVHQSLLLPTPSPAATDDEINMQVCQDRELTATFSPVGHTRTDRGRGGERERGERKRERERERERPHRV